MDDKKTIEQVIEEKSKELGGKIEIVKYVRFELGEGLEKKQMTLLQKLLLKQANGNFKSV